VAKHRRPDTYREDSVTQERNIEGEQFLEPTPAIAGPYSIHIPWQRGIVRFVKSGLFGYDLARGGPDTSW